MNDITFSASYKINDTELANFRLTYNFTTNQTYASEDIYDNSLYVDNKESVDAAYQEFVNEAMIDINKLIS